MTNIVNTNKRDVSNVQRKAELGLGNVDNIGLTEYTRLAYSQIQDFINTGSVFSKVTSKAIPLFELPDKCSIKFFAKLKTSEKTLAIKGELMVSSGRLAENILILDDTAEIAGWDNENADVVTLGGYSPYLFLIDLDDSTDSSCVSSTLFNKTYSDNRYLVTLCTGPIVEGKIQPVEIEYEEIQITLLEYTNTHCVILNPSNEFLTNEGENNVNEFKLPKTFIELNHSKFSSWHDNPFSVGNHADDSSRFRPRVASYNNKVFNYITDFDNLKTDLEDNESNTFSVKFTPTTLRTDEGVDTSSYGLCKISGFTYYKPVDYAKNPPSPSGEGEGENSTVVDNIKNLRRFINGIIGSDTDVITVAQFKNFSEIVFQIIKSMVNEVQETSSVIDIVDGFDSIDNDNIYLFSSPANGRSRFEVSVKSTVSWETGTGKLNTKGVKYNAYIDRGNNDWELLGESDWITIDIPEDIIYIEEDSESEDTNTNPTHISDTSESKIGIVVKENWDWSNSREARIKLLQAASNGNDGLKHIKAEVEGVDGEGTIISDIGTPAEVIFKISQSNASVQRGFVIGGEKFECFNSSNPTDNKTYTYNIDGSSSMSGDLDNTYEYYVLNGVEKQISTLVGSGATISVENGANSWFLLSNTENMLNGNNKATLNYGTNPSFSNKRQDTIILTSPLNKNITNTNLSEINRLTLNVVQSNYSGITPKIFINKTTTVTEIIPGAIKDGEWEEITRFNITTENCNVNDYDIDRSKLVSALSQNIKLEYSVDSNVGSKSATLVLSCNRSGNETASRESEDDSSLTTDYGMITFIHKSNVSSTGKAVLTIKQHYYCPTWKYTLEAADDSYKTPSSSNFTLASSGGTKQIQISSFKVDERGKKNRVSLPWVVSKGYNNNMSSETQNPYYLVTLNNSSGTDGGYVSCSIGNNNLVGSRVFGYGGSSTSDSDSYWASSLNLFPGYGKYILNLNYNTSVGYVKESKVYITQGYTSFSNPVAKINFTSKATTFFSESTMKTTIPSIYLTRSDCFVDNTNPRHTEIPKGIAELGLPKAFKGYLYLPFNFDVTYNSSTNNTLSIIGKNSSTHTSTIYSNNMSRLFPNIGGIRQDLANYYSNPSNYSIEELEKTTSKGYTIGTYEPELMIGVDYAYLKLNVPYVDSNHYKQNAIKISLRDPRTGLMASAKFYIRRG